MANFNFEDDLRPYFDGNDFDLWKFSMKCYLDCDPLDLWWDCVANKGNLPSEKSNWTNSDWEFYGKDIRARTLILRSLCELEQERVKGCKCAFAMWQTLVNFHEAPTPLEQSKEDGEQSNGEPSHDDSMTISDAPIEVNSINFPLNDEIDEIDYFEICDFIENELDSISINSSNSDSIGLTRIVMHTNNELINVSPLVVHNNQECFHNRDKAIFNLKHDYEKEPIPNRDKAIIYLKHGLEQFYFKYRWVLWYYPNPGGLN